MSDIAGGRPPMGGMPPGGNAINQNRSIMNPTDTASMVSDGTITQGMKIRDYIEKVLKVSVEAPVEQLAEAIKRQGMNKTGIGKMSVMAQGGPPQMGAAPGMGQPPPTPGRMPQGRPSAVAPGRGINELMS